MAYITLQRGGSVRLIDINGADWAINHRGGNAASADTSPTAIAVSVKKVSLRRQFQVLKPIDLDFQRRQDGLWRQVALPTKDGAGPSDAVIDLQARIAGDDNFGNNVPVLHRLHSALGGGRSGHPSPGITIQPRV